MDLTSVRLIIPSHARQRRRQRAAAVDLRRLLRPVLPRLDRAVPPGARVAWLDAPGDLIPILERSSRSGPLVVVTVLPRGASLSRRTRPLYLNRGQA